MELKKMNLEIRKYTEKDLTEIIRIWNEVVDEGIAFPQEELLNRETGSKFYRSCRRGWQGTWAIYLAS